ncbi:MAG: ABC transporter substrate-binding protein [Myxococcales bacterium]|nr:ABC transporter substrate-binding protein [Myxococcales bacterium]MDD9966609.1 ABC transporter substrate-binding protein [Myxococcales bacterium]
MRPAIPFAVLALLMAWSTVSLPRTATAEGTPDATAFLKRRHAEVVQILRKKPKSAADKAARETALTQKLSALLDYGELSRRALKDHWETLSNAQRSEFTKLLSQLVERNYQQNLASTIDYKVAYSATETRGEELLVQTRVRSAKNRRAPELTIDYTLLGDASGLRVCDVVTDGVSLVANYRSQFNRIIRKQGFSGLIERMKKKLAEQVGD